MGRMRLASSLFAGALAGLGWAAALQDRLLLQPPRQAVFPDPAVGVVLRDAGGAAIGWLRESDRRPVRGTLVVFHGNAGCAQDHGPLADALASRGLRVVSAEYPGYCGRGGRASVDALLDDARRVAASARERWGAPVVLAGYSLGAAVAATRADDPAVDAFLLITPWASFRALAAHHFPWLPVRWLATDRLETVRQLPAALARGAPVLLLGAARDTIVPIGQARELARRHPGARYMELAAAGHNDWLGHLSPADWDAIVDATVGEWPRRNVQEPVRR